MGQYLSLFRGATGYRYMVRRVVHKEEEEAGFYLSAMQGRRRWGLVPARRARSRSLRVFGGIDACVVAVAGLRLQPGDAPSNLLLAEQAAAQEVERVVVEGARRSSEGTFFRG